MVFRIGAVASTCSESDACRRVCNSFLYIYFILKVNSRVGRNELMLWSFALGLTVDMFGNTPGMNAAAATCLAFTRNSLMRLVTLRDLDEGFRPSIKNLGFSSFFVILY